MTNHQKSALLAAAVAAALLFAAGCSGNKGAPGPPPGESGSSSTTEIRLEDEDPGGTPKAGGRLSFLVRLDATELDPHKMSETTAFVINEQVYESLLQSYRGELQPAIAEEWEVSDDGMELSFNLREDAFFHSGRPVTAEDVKYSLERILNPDTHAPRAGSFQSIESVTAVDQHEVRIALKQPDAALLTMLSTGASSIVDREVAEAGGLNGTVDGGSGPFKLGERVMGQKITLDAHDKYWEEGVPYLDGIDISFNPDDNARASAVRSGTVDFLWRAAPEFADSLMQDEDLKWYGGSGSLSLHLQLNAGKKPFDDVRVRQAVFHALDRQELLDVANAGRGTVLNGGYLPKGRWGALREPVYGEPDLEKAKALLAEAGYPDGFDTTLMVISTSAFQVRQAEVEQQQLAKIGIKVTIESLEATVATERAKSADFDMFQSGFGLTYDPDERFTASYLSDGGLNYGHWADEEYEALIVEARGELDRDKREQLYEDAEQILAERGPSAFTFVDANYDVVQNYVMGYAGDPTPTFRFYKYLWLDK
ncbi:ABC transporter substrate-binding protein [Leucobacter albus]|uniref:ABC transporter substrate-binding protein n=1 Tax=Leucobacter albus TaxID=272210 RepID=A0ABW3TNX8_9MICO